MESASPAQAKKAIRQQNRISAKDFIKMKRGQAKEEKSNSESYQKARSYISEGNVQKFQQFLSGKPEIILNFLFSQDDLKQTPIMQIIKNELACNFLRVVNNWSVKSSDLVIRQIYMEDNQLKYNHFKGKFQALNKNIIEVIDKYITSGNNKSGLILLLKEKDSLFYHLCINFLTLDIIVATITSLKTKNNLLSQYYVNLLTQSQIGAVRSLFQQVKGYQQLLMKEKIWSKVDSGIIKQINIQNIDLLTLSELKYNIWHELANINAVEFLKFCELVCTLGQEKEELQQEYWNILMEIDSSGQSVTDKCLRLWKFDHILQLLTFSKRIQNLMLSTNCLNKLFYNRNLKQHQRQQLITECLEGEISTKGYVKVITNNRQKKWGKNKDKSFSLEVKPIKFTYNICYEKGQIKKQKDNSGGYPLLTYLKIYKNTAKLQTVQQIYLQFLNRKDIKKKLSVILKTSESRRIILNEHSAKRDEIQSLFDFYQPLWKAMTFLHHGDVLEFLISKIYTNCYDIEWIKQALTCEAQLGGTHFIVYYIKNSPFLGQDNINRQIVESIVKCKPSEKNIGQYDLTIQLIKELNIYEPFHKSSQYLVSKIRQYLKTQLLNIPFADYFNVLYGYQQNRNLLGFISDPIIKSKPSILTKDQIIKKCDPQILRGQLIDASIKRQVQIFYRSILAEYNIEIKETSQVYDCFENNSIKNFFQLNNHYLKYSSQKEQNAYVYGQNTKMMKNFFSDLDYWLTENVKNLNGALQQIRYKFLCFMLLPTQKYLKYKFKRLLGIGIDPYFPKYYNFKGYFNEQDVEWNKIMNKMIKEKKTFLCALITSPDVDFEKFKDLFEIQKAQQQGTSSRQKQLIRTKLISEKIQNCGRQYNKYISKEIDDNQFFLANFYRHHLPQTLYFVNHNCGQYNLDTIYKILQHTMRVGENPDFILTLSYYFKKNIKQMTVQIKDQLFLLQKKGKQQKLLQHQHINILKNQLKSFIDRWLPIIISQSNKRSQHFQLYLKKYLRRLLDYAVNSNHKFLCEYLIKHIEFHHIDWGKLFVEKLKYSSDACQILHNYLVNNFDQTFCRWMKQSPRIKDLKQVIRRCQFSSQYKLIKLMLEKIYNLQQKNEQSTKFTLNRRDFWFLVKYLIKIFIGSVSQSNILQVLRIIKDYPIQQSKKQQQISCLSNSIQCKRELVSFTLKTNNSQDMKILRLILKETEQIYLYQDKEIRQYNRNSFYVRSSNEIFTAYISNLQKFYDLSQNITEHLKEAIICLVQAELWQKLQKMLAIKSLQVHTVPLALKSLYNTSGKQQKLQNSQFKKLIQYIFIYLKDKRLQFNEGLFLAAFSLDFKRAFQAFSIKQLSIYGWRKCIMSHPESSTLFLTNKVTLNKDNLPTVISPKEANRYRYWFPMMPHFADAIEENQWNLYEPQWLVDELKVQLYLASILQANKYLSKTLKALCTSQKLLAHKKQIYGEFLTDQQILQFLLRRNQLKSLSKYQKYIPQLNKQLKECLFKKNPLNKFICMNLTFLNPILLKQIIVNKTLYSEDPISMCSYFLRIVDTTNMYVIDLFINANKISITHEYLKNVHQFFGFHFWDRFLAIQNQDFIIAFITKYKLFEIYETQEYSEKLLNNVCKFRHNRLFQFIIKYFEGKSGSKAIFAAQTIQNRPSLSKKGYFYLPIEISILNNFYQVYFLIQSCHNQCPKFNVSARFLSYQQPSSWNYVPQLKRRIQINNIFMEALRQAQQMQFRFDVLLPAIFQLQPQSKKNEPQCEEQEQRSPKKNGYNDYVLKFIQDITKKNLILTSQSCIFEKLCFMIFKKDETKIPESQLQKRYPSQMKLINKVRSHIAESKDISLSHLFECIPEFKSQLLIYNPQEFFKNSEFMQQIMGIGDNKLDFSEYLKGIQINFIEFETKHINVLENYINQYFFNSSVGIGSPHASHQQTREALILILLDISQHERIWDQSYIFNLCKRTERFEPIDYQKMLTQQQNEREPEEVLFDLSMCLNIRGKKEMAFDLMVWNKIIEEIHEIERFWKQFGRGSLRQYNLSAKESNQIAINYSKIGNEKLNNSCIVNLKDILCKVNKQQIKECSKKGVFIQLSIIMNTLLLINDLKMLEQKIKTFNEGKDTYKINFKLIQGIVQQLSSEQDYNYNYISKSIKLQPSQSILVQVPFTIEKHQSKQCLLILIDTKQLLKNLEYFILFHNLQKNVSFVQLNNYFQKADRHSFFKNYKFIYNTQSYKWHQYEGIIHAYGKGAANNTAFKKITERIQKIEDKLMGARNIKVYTASDLYGPINFAQEKDEERIIDCLGFYELIQLPKSTDIKVTSLYEKVQPKQINQLKLSHVQEYLKYYIATTRDEKIDNFDIGHQIFVFEEWFRFGAWTVCEVYCLVLGYCRHLSSKIDKALDVRVSFLSLIQYYEKYIQSEGQLDMRIALQQLLYQKYFSKIIQQIVVMIIEDVVNIMKIVKGIIVKWTINKKGTKKKANIKISQYVNADSVEYEVKDELLSININLQMAKGLNKTEQLNKIHQDCQILVDRKQFLDSVFTSAHFLTDYFIMRNELNNDCLRISTSITNKLNTTVNFHIQYANLYAYIQKMRNEKPVKVIESYLTRLKHYLSYSMEKTINVYLNSQQLANKHQVFILNKCESINKNIPYKQIQSQKQLIYDSLENEPPNGLKEITTLVNEIGNDENIKNVFLIQIYKSYYTTIVGEGMTFVVGYKSNKKKSQVIKITKAENINLINIIQLDFIMLVSKNIPTNDELNQSKIIRIFITDSNKNLYQLNDKIKSYFLALHEQNEQRNLAYFAPLVPSNIMLNFFVDEKKDFDTKDTKKFSVDLNESNKFKLVPNFDKPLSPLNSCKKNTQFKEAISLLQKGFKIFNQSSMKFIIDLPQQYTEKYIGIDFSHIIHLVSTDLLQVLVKFQFQPMRNQQLDCKLSIERQFILNKNSMIQLRKRSFIKHYDRLRIRIRNNSSAISFNGKEIVICIDVTNMTTLPSSSQYLSSFIDNILKNQKKNLYKQVYFNESDKNQSTQILLKELDIINCVPYQVEEIQEAIKLIDLIYHKKIPGFKIVLHKKKTQLKYENGIELYLNVQTAQRQFFSDEQILRSYIVFANKNFEPNLRGQTFFNPITQSIITQECLQKPNKIIYKSLENQWVLENFNETFVPSKCMIPSRYYLVQQDNIYTNYIFKVDQSIAITQKNAQGIRCKSIKLYLQSSKSINLNFTNIFISETNPLFKQNSNNFNILRSPLQKNKIIIQLLSKNMYLLSISYEQSIILNINYSGNTNIFNPQIDSNKLVISSDGQLCLDNTKFIELQAYKKKPVLIKDKQNENKNSQFRQFNQKASGQQLQIKLGDKNNNENLVYVVNDECKKFLTRAGQPRVDYIQLCDNDSNPIDYKQKIDFLFVHINRLAIVRPEIIPRNMQFGLRWTPTVRGHYYLYINSVRINPPYQIGVCAAQADYKTTIITLPKIKKICYCEETELMLDLRDIFNNLYTQLQQDIIGDSLLIGLKCSKLNQSLKIQKSQINKYGLKKVKFSFNNAEQQSATDIEVAVLLNCEEISRFVLTMQGLSLKQRKKILDKDISLSSKNYYKDITINRSKFLQELFVVAQKSLHTNLSVKFLNEPGIDAGGVKRQFYDMIGNEIKSQRNPFFKMINLNTMEYFLNPEILRNKKRLEYMQLWGKYLANSFLNSYLIGVLFSPVLVKLLYEQSIDYEDLLTVLPIEQKKQYEYLLKASPDDFEDLDLYFTVMIDKKKCIQVQLKQGGKDIQVTAQNVRQYLQRTAQVLITQRYKEIMIAFRKGFETVLQLNLFKKWIRNTQFWCLTAGNKQLTPELVLNYIVFQGNNIQNISGWFRRFISEATNEVLVGFLKFSSGSSSIDFSMASKVTVTFQNAGENPKKLPISHTCWKEIVVPKYKNYDIMKKLLTAAFIYCSEGFGFG